MKRRFKSLLKDITKSTVELTEDKPILENISGSCKMEIGANDSSEDEGPALEESDDSSKSNTPVSLCDSLSSKKAKLGEHVATLDTNGIIREVSLSSASRTSIFSPVSVEQERRAREHLINQTLAAVTNDPLYTEVHSPYSADDFDVVKGINGHFQNTASSHFTVMGQLGTLTKKVDRLDAVIRNQNEWLQEINNAMTQRKQQHETESRTNTQPCRSVNGELRNLTKKVDAMEAMVRKQCQFLKEIKNVVVVKKSVIDNVHIATKLLIENDNKVDWLVERINLAEFANRLYLKSGRNALEFSRELAKQFYGDLLAVYKYSVQRNYKDRNQRKSLESLDPTGKQIIQYIIDRYFALHSYELGVEQKLTLRQFHEHTFHAIDHFGSLANYKHHRKEIFVKNTLFYTFVIERNMRPTKTFSKQDRKELTALYKDMLVPKETNKQKLKQRRREEHNNAQCA